MSQFGFTHGRTNCASCYSKDCERSTVVTNRDGSRWQIEQPNGYWGAAAPQVLVLGFSRGPTQSQAQLAFNDIAFKGMRTQLSAILRALHLLGPEPLDEHIAGQHQRFGFGSLIRCSVAQWDDDKQQFSKSGNSILTNFAKGDHTFEIARQCAQHFLAGLPSSVRLVVLMGNSAKYVEFCKKLLAATRGAVTEVNPLSYDCAGVRFVHVIHAKAQGALVPDWLGAKNSQANNRGWAQSAVAALSETPGLLL